MDAKVGLGLAIWQGAYEGKDTTWLRWTNAQGQIIPTGAEQVRRVLEEKDAALRSAELERREKEEALIHVKRLEEQLRSLGIPPHSQR